MKPIRLIPVKKPQIPSLLPLLEEYYTYDGHVLERAKARAALRGLIADPGLGQAWFVLSGPARVGYAICCFGYSIEFGGKYAFVDELFIQEQFRGHGFGAQVLARIESFCRRSGAKTVRLEVERSNHGAQRFYRRGKFKAHDRDLMTRWL